MENVNYNEKIVVPFLEKKCKDLLSVNLVLEAKLLVEQNKLKDLEHVNDKFHEIQLERNRFESERNELLNKCLREESLKNNAISEYQNLNDKYNQLFEKVTLLESELKKKNVKKPVTQMS